MAKFLVIGLVSILLLFPNSLLAAKDPSGRWWQSQKIVKQLSLSEPMIGQLDEQHVESRRKLIDLKANVQKAQLELDVLLEKSELDENAVLGAFKLLESARSSLATERFRFLLQVRKIIGFDNYKKVKRFFQNKNKKKNKKKGKKPPKKKQF